MLLTFFLFQNIRRRVYDALNILESLGIIKMDKKEIRWIGIEEALPIRGINRKVHQTNVSTASSNQRERDGADESEEPEDDDMDIEQLQVCIPMSLSLPCRQVIRLPLPPLH